MTAHPARLAALLASLATLALAAPAAISEPWPHEHSDVPPDSRVTWGRLDNGLRYAVRENHEPRGRVYLILDVHVGSLGERDDQLGYAHFVEHMLFNGTRLYPEDRLVKELQREGLAFGADNSAFTTLDHTFYNLDLPQNSAERIGRGLRVLREFADGATFPKDRLKKEVGVIESERRTRESTATATGEQLDRYLYAASLLARRPPLGTAESVRQATVPRLQEFYRTWYRPSRMTVIAVGDAEPELLVRLIRENFSALQPATPVEPVLPSAGPFATAGGTRARYLTTPVEGGATALIYCLTPPGPDGDTIARRRRNVQEAAGFWILNERLADLAHADAATFGDSQATTRDFRDEVHLAVIRLDCRSGAWRRALRTSEQELRRALTYGFTAGETSEQVRRFHSFYLDAIRTEATLNSGSLAHAIRESLAGNQVFSPAQTNWDIVRDTVDHLAPETCSQQFRAAWAADDRRIAVVGPRSTAASDASVLETFRQGEAGFLSATDEVAGAKFAYDSFGPPGTVVQRQHLASVDADTIEFVNRVRLNLKRTDYEAGRIHLLARLGPGLLAQSEKQAGLAMVASATFLSGGLGRHDEMDLARLMAGDTLSLSFMAGEDAFCFSGVSNRASLSLLLKLLTAFLTDPAYRVGGFQRGMSQLQSFYVEASRDPAAFLHAVAPRIIAGGDMRYGLPTFAQTFSWTPQQVKDWLAPILARGDLEIGLVGDFDPDEAVGLAAATVGTLAAREPNPPVDSRHPPAFPARPVYQTWRIDTPNPKAVVQVSWPGVGDQDYFRTRRLQVLGEILTDRVRLKLREEQGLTYSPAFNVWGSLAWADFGCLTEEVIVAPKQSERTAELIQKIADDIVAHGITDDEFDRAWRPRLATLPQDLRANAYWSDFVVPRLQSYPHGIEAPLTHDSDYLHMRKSEVEAAARSAFGSKRLCVFIVRPK